MTSRERLVRFLAFVSRPTVAIGGALIMGGASIALAWQLTSATPSGAYSIVTTGSVREEVDVSGTVKAAQNADLSFQTTGQVAVISVAVGDHVSAGQKLITLSNATQAAAVALAQANLETQQAKLAALLAGTRPEQLAIDETAAQQARAALDDAIQSAYIMADDAVHAKADQSFSNPRVAAAQLVPLIPDATLASHVEAERVALEPVLGAMQNLIASSGDLEQRVVQVQSDLNTISTFLDDLSTALFKALPDSTTPAATLTGYQTSVDAGRIEISEALTALTSADTAYRTAAGTLALAQAGATQDAINAQQASVDAARASLAVAQAAADQTYLVAPIAGTVAQQNADLGETVTPGMPLVSLVSDGRYQADMQVSEIDVGKIKVGDPVEVTFDAYSGAMFSATVTTVPPAATVVDNASSYTVTVTFDQNDPRIKPGLSANVRIITASKQDALLAPTSAIIIDSAQTFVYLKRDGAVVKTPVTIGIESATGMIEVTSGLVAGDSVLTFGSAAPR